MIPGVTASPGNSNMPSGWVPPSGSSNSLDNAANFFNGWADQLTGGLSKSFRNNMSYGGVPLNHSIDENSAAFAAGSIVGTTHSTVLSFYTPCGAGSMSKGLRLINGLQAGGGLQQAGVNASTGNYGAAFWDFLGGIGAAVGAGQSCFAAGTPILTPNGATAIEKLRPGDLVLSRSEADPGGPVEARAVERVFERYSAIIDLSVAGHVIQTTGEHPFYVRARGWIAAAKLKEGDELSSVDGSWVPIQKVASCAQAAPVYNVRVAEFHTYFVGSQYWAVSLWAHNASPSYTLGMNIETFTTFSRQVGDAAHHIVAAGSKSEYADLRGISSMASLGQTVSTRRLTEFFFRKTLRCPDSWEARARFILRSTRTLITNRSTCDC